MLINGTNFGPAADVPAVWLGRRACGSVQFAQAHSALTCVIPASVGRDLPVTVTVGGVTSAASATRFSYATPVISTVVLSAINEVNASLSAASTRGGGLLNISGQNFPSAIDANVTVTVSLQQTTPVVRNYPCAVVTWVSAQQLLCRTPAGFGTSLAVVVTVADAAQLAPGNTVNAFAVTVTSSGAGKLFSYDVPVVDALTYTVAPTLGNAQVTLSGQNFGPDSSAITVSFTGGSSGLPNTICTLITPSFIAHQRVVCSSPVGAGSMTVTLSLDGYLNAEAPVTYAYDAPVLAALTYPLTSTSGGTTLVFDGVNFGPPGVIASARSVTLGTLICSNIQTFLHTQLQCIAPAGVGSNLAVSVTIAGRSGTNASIIFSYERPSVSTLVYAAASTQGYIPGVTDTARLRIRGQNFGTLGQATTAYIAGVSCLATRWVGTQSGLMEIECDVPPGSGKSHPVTVRVADQESIPSQSTFDYQIPQITQLVFDPAGEPTVGGGFLTVQGANFGPLNVVGQRNITVGGLLCPPVEWRSHGSLVCSVPAGAGRNLPVRVFVSDQSNVIVPSGDPALGFFYRAPQVLSISPSGALYSTAGSAVGVASISC